MRIIALTITERPQYLDRLLCSLRKTLPDGWRLVVAAEPCAYESLQMVELIDYIENVEVLRNKETRGICNNSFELLSTLFSRPEVDSVLYLEEDLVLSPDALKLAEWYMEQSDAEILSFNLFNYDSVPGMEGELLLSEELFNPLGFVLTRQQWKKHFKSHWHDDKRGWDWSITEYQKKNGLKIVQPRTSRINHIGYQGTHATIDFVRQTFDGLKTASVKEAVYHCEDYRWSLVIPYAMRRQYLKRNLEQISSQNREVLSQGEIIIPVIRECDAEEARSLKQENLNIKILHLEPEKNIFKSGPYHFPMALQIFGSNCAAKVCKTDAILFGGPEVISPGESVMALSAEPNSYLRTIYVHWDIDSLPLVNYEIYYQQNKQEGREDSWYASHGERQLYFMFSLKRKDILKIGGVYNEQYVYASDYGDDELCRRLKRNGIDMKEQEACFALHVHHDRNLISNIQNKTWFETNRNQVPVWGHHSTSKFLEKI